MLITICQNQPFGMTGILWRATTVLCGCLSLFYVVSSLCLVVLSLCYVVSPLCLVVTSLRFVVLHYVL